MTAAQVKPLIQAYISNGNSSHFGVGGNHILGYVFTRNQLMTLLGGDNSKHLFGMWGLSPDPTIPGAQFLNLIIGSVVTNTSAPNLGSLELGHFEISSQATFTGPLQLSGGLAVGVTKVNKSGAGVKVPHPALHIMLTDFKTANNNHLVDSNAKKVKGYHIEDNDLISLGLRTPMTAANMNDEFLFMPVIRALQLPVFNFNQPFLSIAVSRFQGGTLQAQAREYCLPCPSACPTNYTTLEI